MQQIRFHNRSTASSGQLQLKPFAAVKLVTGLILFGLGLLFISAKPAVAQAPFPPPNQIQVYELQGISFGTFYPIASGGTVTIDVVGGADVRSTSGGVGIFDIDDSWHAAVIEVVLIPGRLVNIQLQQQPAILNGSNGGTMTMAAGPTDKGDSFVTTGGHPFRNPVRIGGTLSVGSLAVNPPGSYSGSFTITFIQN